MGTEHFILVRWGSKVAEMDAMNRPDFKNIFLKKNSSIFFSEPEKLAALRFWLILGEIPCVESNQFKWKIDGELTLPSSEKKPDKIFFQNPDCS